MRFTILVFVACFTGLVMVLFALPDCKFCLECIVVAVNGFLPLHFFLLNAPVYCYCPRCRKTIYMTRFCTAGKSIRCQDHSDHRLRVP